MLLLIPLGSDGGVQHAFCIVEHKDHGKLIFDSNDEHPLDYTQNAVNFCCSEFLEIQHAILVSLKK